VTLRYLVKDTILKRNLDLDRHGINILFNSVPTRRGHARLSPLIVVPLRKTGLFPAPVCCSNHRLSPERSSESADSLCYGAASSRRVPSGFSMTKSWIVPLYRIEVTRTPAFDSRRA
jgi:hypothetical protein